MDNMENFELLRRSVLDRDKSQCQVIHAQLINGIRDIIRDCPKIEMLQRLKEDTLANALIPDDNLCYEAKKVPGDGNCLYNCVSIFITGDTSLSWKIRIIVAAELFIRASDYADHPILDDVLACKKIFTDHSDTLFSLILSDDGGANFDRTRNREDAIICESVKTCEDNSWSSMVHLLGLCSVLDVCIESVYPNANEGLRPLFNRTIYPLDRTTNDEKQPEFGIIWSRDGNLNTQPGFSYEPNHFALLVPNYDEGNSYEFEKVEDKMSQQSLLSSFFTEGTRRKKLSSVSTAEKSEIASTGTLEPDSNEPQPSVGHHKKFKSIPSLSRKNDLNFAFDVSNYIAEGPDLDDATKINIIQNRIPPAGHNFPATTYRDKRRKSGVSSRRCKREWLENYEHLSYSRIQDGLYCIACILFLSDIKYYKGESIFVKAPCKDWKHLLEYWQLHEKCQYHQVSKDKFGSFVLRHNDPSLRIDAKITEQAGVNFEKNVATLNSIIKCLEFCGRQGIPIRGHRDDSTSCSLNKGNFNALLDMRIDAGDEILKRHLLEGPKNASYISKTTQNDLLECIGSFIQSQIVSEIKNQEGHNYFAIEADEIRDISNLEQLGIAVRYIKNNCAVERILQYVDCESTTGEHICNAIVKCLQDCGLEVKMCRAQTYDGAGNMSGRLKGCRTLFLNFAPRAHYFHCASHILNLALSQSCAQVEVQCMMSTVKEVALFFKYSPKRQRLLESCVQSVNHDRTASEKPKIASQKVKLLCETRWVERHTSLEEFEDTYEAVVECMTRICDPQSKGSWDPKTISEARGLLTSIATPGFLCAFASNRYLFGFTKSLSLLLQGSYQDVVTAYEEIGLIVTELKDIRERADDEFRSNILPVIEKLAVHTDTIISIPRRCKRQTLRGNVEASSPEEYWRRTIFIPLIDHLVAELTDRFQNLSKCAVRGLCLLPRSLPSLNDQIVADIKDFFSDDMPAQTNFDQELKLWKRKWLNIEEAPTTLSTLIQATNAKMFPNIHRIITLLLLIPVSSATVERGNSAIKRIKSSQRSTMGQDRLNALTLLQIHRDIPLDYKKIVDIFINKNPRRMVSNNPFK